MKHCRCGRLNALSAVFAQLTGSHLGSHVCGKLPALTNSPFILFPPVFFYTTFNHLILSRLGEEREGASCREGEGDRGRGASEWVNETDVAI